MPAPIAFVVMPFERKPTGAVEADVPATVDFDAVWERIYAPLLSDAGFRPVRADGDVGALIISQMIQRLAVADLVVADVTLANANVCYEIGVRHAARRTGCVLTAASWAQPTFDLTTIRQLRYPLADGAVGPETAQRAREALADGLDELTHGISPVFDAVPGFPDDIDESRLSAFEDLVAALTSFNADVVAVSVAPESERHQRALDVLAEHGHKRVVRETVVLQLTRLLRDQVGWDAMLDYIGSLPHYIARHPLVVEQQCLALSKTGEPAAAAARLEQLIATDGPTSERYGLLGGRYKQLFRRHALSDTERRRYLNKAINAYERGMLEDLNDYYPASNLPLLYRSRGHDGDDDLAHEAETVTMVACRRSIRRTPGDQWARPTLLGMAFSRGDLAEIDRLHNEIEIEGTARWQLETTIDDLLDHIEQHSDDRLLAEQLRLRLDALRSLIPT